MPMYRYLTQVVHSAARARPDQPCLIFWAGAVATPLNVHWTPDELAYALNDCGASALLIDDACLPVAGALRQDVPGLRTVVHLGDGPLPDGMPA
jgi:acyl-CoA synthetase (AMP-forming)/AMP-acid ligase II